MSSGPVGRIVAVDYDNEGRQIMTMELRIALDETTRQTLGVTYGTGTAAWLGRDVTINASPVADAVARRPIGFLPR